MSDSNRALTTVAMRIPHSPHVLVIDGEHLMRVRLRTLLEAAGCEVSTATDGHMALDLLGSFDRPPGLIFLNPATRLIAGSDFMTRLRQAPQSAVTPVVVLQSSSKDSVDGAVALLHKQASDEEILEMVARHSR